MTELVYARDELCDSNEHGNFMLTSKGIEGITASSNDHFLATNFDPDLPSAVDIQVGAK